MYVTNNSHNDHLFLMINKFVLNDQQMMVLRIQDTFCCSARLLMINEEIFSLELKNYYDLLCKSLTFQMML